MDGGKGVVEVGRGGAWTPGEVQGVLGTQTTSCSSCN